MIMYRKGVVPGIHYCMSFNKRVPYGVLLLKDIQSSHNEIFQLICLFLDGLNLFKDSH